MTLCTEGAKPAQSGDNAEGARPSASECNRALRGFWAPNALGIESWPTFSIRPARTIFVCRSDTWVDWLRHDGYGMSSCRTVFRTGDGALAHGTMRAFITLATGHRENG